MKLKTLSLSTILGALGIILLLQSLSAKASEGKISCQTSYGEKHLLIDDYHVSFQKEEQKGQFRTLSSIGQDQMRTQLQGTGFSKVLFIDGNKYRIFIKNKSQFNDTEDYLTITSPKGHEMTYPLNCHSA